MDSYQHPRKAGGDWTLQREGSLWQLYGGQSGEVVTSIQLNQDTAWRLCTKGISIDEAKSRIEFNGDSGLREPFLHMVSIMA